MILNCQNNLGEFDAVIRGGEEVLRLLSENKQLVPSKRQHAWEDATVALAFACKSKKDFKMCEFYCRNYLDQREVDSVVQPKTIRVLTLLSQAQFNNGDEEGGEESLLAAEDELAAYRELDSAQDSNYFVYAETTYTWLKGMYEHRGIPKKVREYKKKLQALYRDYPELTEEFGLQK